MWAEQTVAPVTEAVTTSTRRSHNVAALDGIRALAVTAVLCFHAGFPTFPGGFLGVDVFFALSGFLIGGILVRTLSGEAGARGLPDFWLRRARRLFPALFLVVLVVAVHRFVFLYGDIAAGWRNDVLAAIAYATNWLQIAVGQDYFAQWLDPSPLLQTWSLSIEEQFYLIFPLLLLGLLRLRIVRKRLVGVLAAVGLASAASMAFLASSGASAERLYYGTDTRAQALLLGAAMGAAIPRLAAYRSEHPGHLVSVRVVAGWLGLAGVLALIATMHADSPLLYRGGFLLVAAASLGLVWGALGSESTGVNRLLSLRPLVFIGMISYGIYLWHWPIFLALRGEPDGQVPAGIQVARFALTFLVAVASFYVVERPIRSRGFAAWPARRQWRAFALAAIVLVILAVVPTARDMWAKESLPGQWPDAAEVPRTVFVGGDSAATVLATAFPKDRYPDTTVLASQTMGCGLGTQQFFRGDEPMDISGPCAQWEQHWRDQMAIQPVNRSLVMMTIWDLFDRDVDGRRYGPGTQPFRESLADGVRTAIRIAGRDGSVSVDVWGFPCFDTALPQQLYLNDRSRIDEGNQIAEEVTAEFPNARWIDFRPLTCTADGPVREVGGQPIRMDGIHWTPFGADYVWQRVLTEFTQKAAGSSDRGTG